MSRNHLNILYFILLSLFWGASFVAIKAVVSVFPPFLGAAIRVGLATLIVGAIALATKQKVVTSWALTKRVWLAGVFSLGIPFAFLFWGEQRITPGLAGIFNGTVPIWTFLLGWTFARQLDTFSGRKFLGLLVGVVGTVLIFSPLFYMDLKGSSASGMLAVWGMALSYAVGSLLTRKILSGQKDSIPFMVNAFHQHVASFVFLLAASLFFETWPSVLTVSSAPVAILSVVYLSVFSTALAMLMFYRLIQDWGVVRASSVTYVVPVLGLFWDYLFFGNIPNQSELGGTLLILVGVVLIQRSGGSSVNVTLSQTRSVPKISPRPRTV